MAKTNIGLVEYAKAKIGKPYWYGTFGQIATESLFHAKKRQYPNYYTASNYPSQYGKQVFDCIGLIKAYMWTDSISDTTPVYNASQDWGANQTYEKCAEKGLIANMPEIPGILVFLSGHVGVYIGNGEVIEARGHAYGVVKTRLKDRPWRRWGKYPLISYSGAAPPIPAKPATQNKTVKELTGVELINYGNRGYGVQLMQAELAKLGYYTTTIDGIFGSGTLAAVKKFQSAYNLSVDGIVGAKTAAKLAQLIAG